MSPMGSESVKSEHFILNADTVALGLAIENLCFIADSVKASPSLRALTSLSCFDVFDVFIVSPFSVEKDFFVLKFNQLNIVPPFL